ncbi:hypothetical protein O3P69_018970 [Scylla paramamosain]|uniref:Uncharacterized protein n=1 Tax=Scylla paramamosain TaxID=85552 RepID=A0AAW0S8R9_SCYPA
MKHLTALLHTLFGPLASAMRKLAGRRRRWRVKAARHPPAAPQTTVTSEQLSSLIPLWRPANLTIWKK